MVREHQVKCIERSENIIFFSTKTIGAKYAKIWIMKDTILVPCLRVVRKKEQQQQNTKS
jgi:hypothetical protein